MTPDSSLTPEAREALERMEAEEDWLVGRLGRPAKAPDRPPCVPTSLHWLGDREDADATRHATDMRGCVLYFEQQSDCLQFMRWLERQASLSNG